MPFGNASKPLAGKAVLDIGCNEGFFCAEAIRQGAARVIGIDANKHWVDKAKVRVPEAEFRNASWWDLPDEKFDVIFFLSAIHYEAEPRKLLRKLVTHLTDNGVLILECGVKGKDTKSWGVVERWDGPKRYPSLDLLRDELLADYGVRFIGASVNQTGDPIPRYVFHCQPRRPVAMIITGRARAGKTALARSLMGKGITIYDSDSTIMKLVTNSDYASLPLAKDISAAFEKTEKNFGKVGNFIASNPKLTNMFCELVSSEAPTDSDLFVIEGEIFRHGEVQKALMSRLAATGVRTWMVQPQDFPT